MVWKSWQRLSGATLYNLMLQLWLTSCSAKRFTMESCWEMVDSFDYYAWLQCNNLYCSRSNKQKHSKERTGIVTNFLHINMCLCDFGSKGAADFREALISISKSSLSRKILISFSISTLNFVARTLILILNSHPQTLKNLRNLDWNSVDFSGKFSNILFQFWCFNNKDFNTKSHTKLHSHS